MYTVQCPRDGCTYRGETPRSVSTHWAHKHGGPCPITTTRKVCRHCGAAFSASNAMLRHRPIEFCSRKCWSDDQHARALHVQATLLLPPSKRVQLRCQHCGNDFTEIRYRADRGRRFCSHRCASLAKDEGKTPVQERYRDAEAARGWRKDVFERDNYTCRLCWTTGGVLHAHHLVPVAEIVASLADGTAFDSHPLFADVENGLTLCAGCHGNHHHGA